MHVHVGVHVNNLICTLYLVKKNTNIFLYICSPLKRAIHDCKTSDGIFSECDNFSLKITGFYIQIVLNSWKSNSLSGHKKNDIKINIFKFVLKQKHVNK